MIRSGAHTDGGDLDVGAFTKHGVRFGRARCLCGWRDSVRHLLLPELAWWALRVHTLTMHREGLTSASR